MDSPPNTFQPAEQPQGDGAILEPRPGQAPSRPGGDYGRLVPAADQALRLLFELAGVPGGQATLSELSRRAGISRSKGSALLATLASAGVVTRNEATKSYSLGPALLVLSRALLDQGDLPRAAAPFLDHLAATTGCSALLCLISNGQVFVVGRREAPPGLGVAIRVGHCYPLTWGAHGKAIVAFLPPDRQEEILSHPPLYFAGEGKALDLDAVRRELAEVRRLGYAIDLGGAQPGLNAVSAPLLGGTGASDPAGCLVVLGTFPPGEAAVYGGLLAGVAREMTLHLKPLLPGTA